VEILYRSNQLQKICSSEAKMRRKFGDRQAERLMQRLAELKGADCLEDMRYFPAVRCHELHQDREGQLAVDLIHPKRLIFKPDHDPIPLKDDGGLDWTLVTSILIIEVVDYH
jgi:plasmid maintenance system killer protein